mgnify:CR=1 FL=1
MRLNRSRRSSKVQGVIGFHGLSDWWLGTFSDRERKHIQACYQPYGSPGNTLTQGTFETSQSACSLLSGVPGFLEYPQDLPLARKFFQKAEEIGSRDILDMHFLYLAEIRIFYRQRNNDPDALREAIEACKKQIQIAPQAAMAFEKTEYIDRIPAHTGYKQLAIIYDKQGRYEEAVELSRQAKTQGWDGDWDRRIERLHKKLKRQSK